MTILYDEKCKFCTSFTKWALKKNKNFILFPIRSKEAKNLLKTKGITFINLQTIYYIDNFVFLKSKAIFKILAKTNSLYKILCVFSFLPIKFTDFFYTIFAKYRHKF